MYKKAKRIIAVLLTAAMIWQPSWSGSLVNAEEVQTDSAQTETGGQLQDVIAVEEQQPDDADNAQDAQSEGGQAVQEEQEKVLEEQLAKEEAEQEDKEREDARERFEEERVLLEIEEQEEFSAEDVQSIAAPDDMKFVWIKDIRLDCEDPDNISAGDEFNLIVTLHNDFDEQMRVKGGARWEDESSTNIVESNMEAFVVVEAGSDVDITIPVEINPYKGGGEQRLYWINYDVANMSWDWLYEGKMYVYKEGQSDEPIVWQWESWEDGNYYDMPEYAQYPYVDEADFTVANAPKPDTEAPSVTGVRVTTEEPSTYGDITVEVDYSDDVSGIREIEVEFGVMKDEEEYERFRLTEEDLAAEQYKGGTLEITNTGIRELGAEYQLMMVSITDYAGNFKQYYRLSDDDKLWSNEGEGGFDSVTYKIVKEGTLPYVMITDIKLDCEDKDNVSAGDNFNLVVTLQNNMDQAVTVKGTAYWENSDTNSSDEELKLYANEKGDLKLPITISKYCSEKEVSLYDFDYYVYDLSGEEIAYSYYYPNWSYDWFEGDESYSIPDSLGYPYNGEADYKITHAPTPDTGAPEITSAKVSGSTDVATMDNVEITVDYSEDASGIQYMYLDFENENGDMVTFWLNEEDTEEGQYTGTGTLSISSDSTKKFDTTYKLTDIYVTDYAGNSRTYRNYDGMIREAEDSETGFSQPVFRVTEKTPLKYLLLDNIEIVDNNGNAIDNTDITAGDPVYIKVTFKNGTGEAVRLTDFRVGWDSGEESYEDWASLYETIGPDESVSGMMQAPNSKYGEERSWTLNNIYYNFYMQDTSNSGYGHYSRDDYYGDSYGYSINWNWFELPVEDIIEYNGQGDYTIAHAPYTDKEAPVISSVMVMGTDSSSAEITTVEDVELQVRYTEAGAGISKITVGFLSDRGKTETYELSGEEEQYKGTDQILTLNKNAYREMDDVYRLTSIYVEDCAGNSRSYSLEDGNLVPDDGYDQDAVAQTSYRVTGETDLEMAFIREMHLERTDGEAIDENNINAGDELMLVLDFKNSFDKDISMEIYADWRDAEGNYYALANEPGIKVTSDNGGSTVRIPFEVPRFSAEKWNYYLNGISYYITGENAYATGRVTTDGNHSYNVQGLFEEELELPMPDGDINFRVATSETPDMEPPHVTSIQTESDQTEAPGTVKFEIYAETGPAKISSITSFYLEDTADSGNMVYPSVADLYYSPSKRCYILEIELSEDVLTGEYFIEHLTVEDEAGRSTTYFSYNEISDKLQGGDGNTFDNVYIKVINENMVSDDFDAPVVTGLTMTPDEIQAPGKITYTLTASDESGISGLYLHYRRDSGGAISINVPMEQSGDKWQGTYDVGAYLTPGEYRLQEITIIDGSGRDNQTYISRSANEKLLSQCDLTVLPDADTMYLSGAEEEMQKQLASAKDGATVAISIGGGDYVSISASNMQIIKNKGLDVIIVSDDGKQELHFSGKDLTDEMVRKTLHLGVYASGFYEANQLEFENGYDRACQWFYISSYGGTKVPFAVRLRLDDRFMAKVEQAGNARLSQYGTPYFKIIEENIKLSDGCYVMEFPDGYNGHGQYAISTDTVKFFDYPLTVTATPSFSSDAVVKGSSFDVQLSVTNKNDVTLEDVALFVLNDEELCEWYTFDSDDPNVQIGEGEDAYAALVSRFEAGQTVKLTAKFTIPEDAEGERIPLYFVVSSVTDTDELISYGDYEMRITLQDANSIVLGDISGDGQVDIADLTFMLQYINKRIDSSTVTKEQLLAGDVSRNGTDEAGMVDISDLTKLLQYLNKRITSLE